MTKQLFITLPFSRISLFILIIGLLLGTTQLGYGQADGLTGPYRVYASVSSCNPLDPVEHQETHNTFGITTVSASCLFQNNSTIAATFPSSISVLFKWRTACPTCPGDKEYNEHSSTTVIPQANILLGSGNASVSPPKLVSGPQAFKIGSSTPNNSVCESEAIELRVLAGFPDAVTYLAGKGIKYRWREHIGGNPFGNVIGETTVPKYNIPANTYSTELQTVTHLEKTYSCQLVANDGTQSEELSLGQTIFIYPDAPILGSEVIVNWKASDYNIIDNGVTIGKVTVNHNTCKDGSNASLQIGFNSNVNNQYFYTLRKITGGPLIMNMQAGASGATPTLDAFPANSSNSSPLVSGTYELVIEVLSGGQRFCSSTKTITIKEPPAVTLTAAQEKAISCYQGSDGQIKVTLGGGILSQGITGKFDVVVYKDGVATPLSQSDIAAGDSHTFTDLGPGKYSFEVTENNGCGTITKKFPRVSGNESFIELTAPPLIALNVTPQAISCRGGTGGLQVQLSGGQASSTYQAEVYDAVSNTRLTPQPTASINAATLVHNSVVTFSGLAPGQYKVKVHNTNGACASDQTPFSATYSFTNPAAVVASLNQTQQVSCAGASDGRLTVDLTSGKDSTTLYNIELVRTNDNQSFGTQALSVTGGIRSFNNLPAGNFEARITQQGCTSTEVFPIVINQPLSITATIAPKIQFDTYHITCDQGSDGTISVTGVSGGNGGYTIKVQEAGGGAVLQTVNGTSATFAGLSAGAYDILITDSKSCALNTFGVQLIAPPAISATLTPQRVRCKGESNGSIAAKISGGIKPYKIQWINTTTNTAVTNIIVLGDTQDEHTLADQPAGNYQLLVQDDKKCPTLVTTDWYEATTTIAEPNMAFAFTPTAFIVDSVACHGGNDGRITLAVAGGWGNYTYSKDGTNFQASPVFGGFVAGTHTLYAKDAQSCTISTQVTVREPNLLTLTQQQISQVSCKNGYNGVFTFEAKGGNDAGSQPYTLLVNGTAYSETDWSNWASNRRITLRGLAAGDYTIQATDRKNCQQTLDFTITEPPLLSATLTNVVTATCGLANGSAQVQVSGGTAPYTYVWQKPETGTGTLKTWSTTTALSNAESGAYEMVVTDALGCSVTKVAQISNADAATVQLQNITPTTCAENKDGQVTVKISSTSFPVTVTWVNTADETGQITPQDASTVLLSGLSKGYHDFQTRDSKGCIRFEKVFIPGPEPLLISRVGSNDPSCHNQTDGSLAIGVSGGTAPYTITWNQGLAAGTTSFSNLAAGTYTVQVSDSKGCQRQASFVLQNPLPISVDLGGGSTVCAGQSVTLKPTIPAGNTIASYRWTSANGTFSSTTSEVTVSTADTYFLTVTTTTGCSGTGSYKLENATDTFVAEFLMADQAIVGDTIAAIEICRPAPTSVFWDIEGIGSDKVTSLAPTATIPDQKLIYHTPGTYTVKLYASAGNCQDVFTHQITILKGDDKRLGGQSQAAQTGSIKQSISAKASPNPISSGRFKLEVDLTKEESVKVDIFQMATGKRWRLPQSLTGSGNTHYEWQVEVPQMTEGAYVVRVQTPSQQKIVKVVVN